MSEQQKAEQQHSDDISRAGRREWEGEHAVEIKATAPTWDTKLLIDGKSLSADVKRIEIDIDVEKMTPIAKLTRLYRDEDGRPVSEEATLKTYTQQLVMNALDITSEEMLVVDMILESARAAAMREQVAVQLFAIGATDDETGERVSATLDALFRDAKRYRALRRLIQEENDAIELHASARGVLSPYDEDGLDRVADELWQQQREQRQIEQNAQRQRPEPGSVNSWASDSVNDEIGGV